MSDAQSNIEIVVEFRYVLISSMGLESIANLYQRRPRAAVLQPTQTPTTPTIDR